MDPVLVSTTTKTYRLGSTEMFHAPGFIRWLRAMYKMEPERAIKLLLLAYEDLPAHVGEHLLIYPTGPSTDGDTVIVTYTSSP